MTANISEKDKHIYMVMGITLHQLHAFENLFKFVMTFIIQRDSPLNIDKYERLEKEYSKKTLGYFLKELRLRAVVSDEYADLLEELLEKRNIFIHCPGTIQGWDLFSNEGQKIAEAFMARLASIAGTLNLLHSGFIYDWSKETGIPCGNIPDPAMEELIKTNYSGKINLLLRAKPLGQ
jgi:hypothetical protein